MPRHSRRVIVRIRSKEIRRSRKREENRILDIVKAARAARPPKAAAKPAARTAPAVGGAARPASAPRQRPPRAAAPAAPAAPPAETPTTEG